MHGKLGLLESGDPVWLADDPSSLENETKAEKREHHTGFSFNKYRSDATPLDRYNGDFRSDECKNMENSYTTAVRCWVRLLVVLRQLL